MTETEIYVVCADYPKYSVSNFGNVKNNQTQHVLSKRPRDKRAVNYCVDLHDKNGNHQVYVHRLVATAFIPNPDDLPFVDHIDNTPSNNHVSNLRWVTKHQNSFNALKRKGDCSSKFKGVMKRNDSGRYRARIRYNGNLINLGTYANEEDAARAYDEKAKELFGEYAVLNFS